ncbi:MAG: hypothetical protein A2275_00860 [Bacteroidetes bacterium RIFOXYA12_FULL_35_11]|nr:MAG: hypothetical protein A2X01_17215 [Bacteroidetes bacterium GWF2_35_48]OFY74039.1 MAG: hypothetical protein A2275_00860 [Bacteroidetes bacterium RIFOXYA12_FULL_35_11]OFY97744.1 MAG: hypothetical protein A2309_10540 [Bacteroidetes bacterium RIFOXYB2_FULL_35_7]HBX53023.1 xanthine dehydrogenase [Bacteroidales bacterium]
MQVKKKFIYKEIIAAKIRNNAIKIISVKQKNNIFVIATKFIKMKSIFQHLADLENDNINAAFCIVVETFGSSPRKSSSKMIVTETGTIIGTVGGGTIEKTVIEEAQKVILSKAPVLLKYDLKKDLAMECGGNMEVYIEPVSRKIPLHIFGAGHIGKALAKFSVELGFDVTVIDERIDVFNDFSEIKCACINKDYKEILDNIKFDRKTFIVIVTYNHMHDFDILKLACKKEHAYLGMIGSKRKVAEVKKMLNDEKILTPEEIEKIDMPIGIKFAAETPQEIAVSILAKLIDVRNTLR